MHCRYTCILTYGVLELLTPMAYPAKFKVLVAGDSRLRGWSDLLNQAAYERDFFDVEFHVKACPGATSEQVVDEVIRRSVFIDYDLVYFMAGINNLTYKIKGRNAAPRFETPTVAFCYLKSEYVEAKRRLEQFARTVVLCELVGLSLANYNTSFRVPRTDQTTINSTILAINREVHSLNTDSGVLTPRFERHIHRLRHGVRGHRYDATLADGLHFNNETSFRFVHALLDTVYRNIRATCN